jgi:hypothetical protein
LLLIKVANLLGCLVVEVRRHGQVIERLHHNSRSKVGEDG